MSRYRHPEHVHLRARTLLDIHDGKGLSVASLEGSLWITQSGDPRDIVLEAGEAFTLDRQGLALVSALTDATVEVGAASSRQSQRSRPNGSAEAQLSVAA